MRFESRALTCFTFTIFLFYFFSLFYCLCFAFPFIFVFLQLFTIFFCFLNVSFSLTFLSYFLFLFLFSFFGHSFVCPFIYCFASSILDFLLFLYCLFFHNLLPIMFSCYFSLQPLFYFLSCLVTFPSPCSFSSSLSYITAVRIPLVSRSSINYPQSLFLLFLVVCFLLLRQAFPLTLFARVFLLSALISYRCFLFSPALTFDFIFRFASFLSLSLPVAVCLLVF